MKGIYIIKCNQDEEVYIGSSVAIKTRWVHHKWLLDHDKHHNYKLQMAWNAYGDESFVFEVLEETDDIECREQFWVDYFWPKCYNIIQRVDRSNFSSENMQAMLNSRFEKRESYGTGNTLTETQVKEIIVRINNKEPHKEIAKDYNIEINSVSNIKTGATWKYLNHHVNNENADNKEKRLQSKAQAFELFRQGMTQRQVRDSIGRSKATISRYYQEYVKIH